jgi:hypothetical protein
VSPHGLPLSCHCPTVFPASRLGLLDFTCKPAFFPHRAVPSRLASSAMPHNYICQTQMTHIYPPAGAPESSAGRPHKYIRQTQMTYIYLPAGAPEFLSQAAPQVHNYARSNVTKCLYKPHPRITPPEPYPAPCPILRNALGRSIFGHTHLVFSRLN